MHPQTLKIRETESSKRITAAAKTLARRFDLDANTLKVEALAEEPVEPEVEQMLRNEAVADLLELLVKSIPRK